MYLRPRADLQIAPDDGGQVLAGLDAEDTSTLAGEGGRGLARAAANLESSSPRGYLGERDHVIEEFLWVTGSHLIVE